MIRAHRTQGVALGYHLAPRWGKRPLDRVRWNILPRPVVAKDPWGRTINHRTPTAPKGQNEIAQGRAKRRPGYGSGWVDAPRGSALSGLGRIRAHRTQGVALGYHLAPRWGKRPLDRVRWNILPRPVVAKDPWGRTINHRTPTAPKGQNEIAQGRAKRRPGYACAEKNPIRPVCACIVVPALRAWNSQREPLHEMVFRPGRPAHPLPGS